VKGQRVSLAEFVDDDEQHTSTMVIQLAAFVNPAARTDR
jgi:hypothetical protein